MGRGQVTGRNDYSLRAGQREEDKRDLFFPHGMDFRRKAQASRPPPFGRTEAQSLAPCRSHERYNEAQLRSTNIRGLQYGNAQGTWAGKLDRNNVEAYLPEEDSGGIFLKIVLLLQPQNPNRNRKTPSTPGDKRRGAVVDARLRETESMPQDTILNLFLVLFPSAFSIFATVSVNFRLSEKRQATPRKFPEVFSSGDKMAAVKWFFLKTLSAFFFSIPQACRRFCE